MDESWGYLPVSIWKWAELPNNNPQLHIPSTDPLFEQIAIRFSYTGGDLVVDLAGLNDERFTFKKIAELIAKYL